MPNPGMKSPIMNRQQFMQQFMRKPQPTPNMAANMANMIGHGGFNNKPNFPNQVGTIDIQKC
jgi:hypothetical protein